MFSRGRHTAETQTGEVICGIARIHTAVTYLIRVIWAPVSNFDRSQAAINYGFTVILLHHSSHASTDSADTHNHTTPSSGPQTLHMRHIYFHNQIHDVRRTTGRITNNIVTIRLKPW
jgi:hypothetical protein